MRDKIVAGNWKMNLALPSALKLVKEIKAGLPEKLYTKVIVAPAFPLLSDVFKELQNTPVQLSAQNVSEHEKGAYTGEVSAEMLASVGCSYVIIGHSERRTYFKETSAQLLEKIKRALEYELCVIYCVGETLKERESGKHFSVIEKQLKEVVFNLSEDDFQHIVIAYEPVWAIGTGKTASPEDAQEVHAFIRKNIEARFGKVTAQNTSVLYGGSCKPSNAKQLFSQKDIDGGLIGGASLNSDDFLNLITLCEANRD